MDSRFNVAGLYDTLQCLWTFGRQDNSNGHSKRVYDHFQDGRDHPFHFDRLPSRFDVLTVFSITNQGPELFLVLRAVPSSDIAINQHEDLTISHQRLPYLV